MGWLAGTVRPFTLHPTLRSAQAGHHLLHLHIYTYVIRTGLDVIIISLLTHHLLAILPDHSLALQTARDMRWNEPHSALLQSQAQLASVLGGSSVKLCSGLHSTRLSLKVFARVNWHQYFFVCFYLFLFFFPSLPIPLQHILF